MLVLHNGTMEAHCIQGAPTIHVVGYKVGEESEKDRQMTVFKRQEEGQKKRPRGVLAGEKNQRYPRANRAGK